MKRILLAFALAMAAVTAHAQDSVTFKLGHYLPAQHPMSAYLDNWAKSLNEKSDGRITIEIFPSGQLAPVPEIYDATRRGIIDIGWILHGATSDRFPLTGLIDIPFTVDSATHATKILNDPQMRAILDKEHRGVKVLYLFTHQPAQIHTAGKAVAQPSDLKGMRIRFPSATAKAYLDEMGAASVGLPPTQIAENLQKTTIDGVVIDYGGAGLAFKLGGLIDYVTEFNGYVTSFGLIMNEDAYASIPDDLKPLFDESITGIEEAVGAVWDNQDPPGKAALVEGGAEIIVPSEEAMAAFKAAADTVGARIIEERGPQAAEARALMLELADKYR
ncbi:TRAP transporter substrate-binding protein [Acuticoccus kandeliae]|uniref:TRAP transporter substrate-binding protein n=1 Tax=Acuticoccus kandeliae TaxID=2073160 RepID=UPI000D3E3349|nr:TRAP transporter substrate-binding protein [Acuticoccus kandeliae]